jgi:CRISPR-associated protein Csm5
MRVFGAADSDPVPVTSFKIYLSRTASLDLRQPDKPQLVWKVAGRGSVAAQRANEATPVFAEMAIPGTAFSGKCEEHVFLKQPDLARSLGWRAAPDIETIIAAANKYAASQLDLHAQYAQATGLTVLQQTVDHLRAELETAQATPNSCLLCLGWGGGFLSKVSFHDTETDAYRKILRAIPSIGKAIRDKILFPKTRRVVFIEGKPAALPGWAVLQLKG